MNSLVREAEDAPGLTPEKREELLRQGFAEVDPTKVRLIYGRNDMILFVKPDIDRVKESDE